MHKNTHILHLKPFIHSFQKGYDETYLAGHALSLYFDGTETSSITLAYTMYELARNPLCQQKVYDEVTTILAKHNGQITYESVQEMTYIDSIIHESIRIHPPAFQLAKLCTKSYTMPMTSGQTEPLTIPPGTVIQIPIFGLQM